MIKKKLRSWLFILFSTLAFSGLMGCEKDPNIPPDPQSSELLFPESNNRDSFFRGPGKSIFYWQTNEFTCNDHDDSMTFKGLVYDAMAPSKREPMPSGVFHLDNQTFKPGPDKYNYEYNKNRRESLSAKYAGTQIKVRLDDKQGNPVYDTAIKILERPNIDCHDSCISENTCFEVSTTFKSNYAAVIVTNQAGSDETIRNKKVLNTEGGLTQVCFDGLLNQFNPGDEVDVDIVRGKFYKVTGTHGKIHRLGSMSFDDRTYEVCQ